MPNKNVFCNTPWYELHIYWDGGYGICCQESIRPYTNSDIYNVKSMSLKEWFNSDITKSFRTSMFGDTMPKACSTCMLEEKSSSTSRRHRSNQRSVIFTRGNFAESYEQSPGYNKFEHSSTNDGDYGGLPVDLHIDLGNYCNLTCKMCRPEASSAIASQYVKWGKVDAAQYVGTDWTRDDAVWDRVLNEIADIPNLKNIHFMGGETLITKRFEDFVDFMINRKKFDLNFSFVTNGTIFNDSLLAKLKKFGRVGIEISIETITAHNAYQRQGTDTSLVLRNIDKYIEHSANSNISVTVRPAISLLTIGNYGSLLEYAATKGLLIKALAVNMPSFLDVKILPDNVKAMYVKEYQKLLSSLDLHRVNDKVDYNESDPHQFMRNIRTQIEWCIGLLTAKALPNREALLQEMVQYCKKWDAVHKYNALELYPELSETFIKYGYTQT